MSKHVPKWPIRFLRWFCPPQLLEEIEGDLLQRYERDTNTIGERRAARRLGWNSIRYFRPGILLRNKFTSTYSPMQLFKNNIAMAFRAMRKDKLFTSINLFGLTASLAACLLIFQYAFFELNYDKGGTQPKHVQRVTLSNYLSGELTSQTALTPSTLGPTLKARLPEVEQTARLYSTRYWFSCTLSYSTENDLKIFNEKKLYYVDPSALNMFSYRLVRGDANTALSNPYSLVLSERVAKKYFGDIDPIGKTMFLKGSYEGRDYLVTGVMTDPRPDSHIDGDIFASIATLENNPGFNFSDSYLYLQLTPFFNEKEFDKKLGALAAELAPPKDGRSSLIDIEPVGDVHFNSHVIDQMKPSGNLNVIYVLLAVALTVLIMALINYVNLTTARSLTRAKEVGIRKIAGASRRQVAGKFLTEVALFNSIALASAVGTAYLLAPYFYSFMRVPVPPNYLLNANFGIPGYMLLAILVIGILVSGLFPALSLSAFQPIRVLKARWQNQRSGFSLQKVMVVVQFTCAATFAIAVLTFNRQFDFIHSQDLGIDVDKTLIVHAPANVDSTYSHKLSGFKNEMRQLAIVESIATSSAIPGNSIGWTASIRRETGKPGREFTVNVIDVDFLGTYNLKLLAGRHFTEADYPGDQFGRKIEPLMVNLAGMKQLGIANAEEAIGAKVFWGDIECRLVGIVDNFYQESFKKAIQPQMFTAGNGPMVSMKLVNNEKEFAVTLDVIRSYWSKYFPNNAFEYFFLESAFDEQYALDEQIARVFNFFCALALLVSCLGLFALSLFSVQLRTKEVSIRKVLGATGAHLLQLLTREYLLLILIAAIFATPLSFWGIDKWLSGFAVHIDQTMWMYVIPILFILAVALLTVAGQTVKVILKNPTENLKHE